MGWELTKFFLGEMSKGNEVLSSLSPLIRDTQESKILVLMKGKKSISFYGGITEYETPRSPLSKH